MKRLPALLGALLGGFVVGALATVYHSVWFPVGLALGATLVAGLLSALRLVSPGRLIAGVAGAGIVAAVITMAGNDGQGSVLVMPNLPGFVFLGTITLVVTVVLAWPRLSSSKTGYDEVASVSERNPLS